MKLEFFHKTLIATTLTVVATFALLGRSSGEPRLADLDVSMKLNQIPRGTIFEVVIPKEVQGWQLKHREGNRYSRNIYFMSGDYQRNEPSSLKTHCSFNIERYSFSAIPPAMKVRVLDSDYKTYVNGMGYVLEVTMDLEWLDYVPSRDGTLKVQLNCSSGVNQSFRGSLRIGNLKYAFGEALKP